MATNEARFGGMIQEYYVQRVRALAAKRAAEREKIRTPGQVMALRREVRAKLRKCFGSLPARTPLKPQITGTVERREYVIEKILFESRPGLLVTANLYLPRRGRGPFPAVLGTCGHSQNGKAYARYQAFSQNFARQGYAVLIYDPLSQGERYQYPRREGRAQPVGCCQEHNMMGNALGLLDEFFGAWRLWDGIRALDYLLSRPEVDRTRVGVTGQSGGGTMATYLTAMEDRFTMAAPSCFVTTYLYDLENELPADSEQIPPGIIAEGLDHADFFIAQIPRPTILLGQNNDFFDRRGLEQTYEELRRLYRILGKEDCIALQIGDTVHDYSRDNREAAYRFFNRHAGVQASGREPGEPVLEKDRTLQVTPRGQVHYLGKRRVFDFIRERGRALAERRRPVAASTLAARLARVLQLPPREGTPHFRVLRLSAFPQRKNIWHSRLAVETEPGILAILHAFKPKSYYFYFPRESKVTLYVPHLSSTDDVAARKSPAGWPLFAVDVRGFGEVASRSCSDQPFFTPYDIDYFYYSHGLMLNESYCGRRVQDLLRVLDLFGANGCRQIHLVGRGMGAVSAAYAACLHPLVRKVTLINALLSYHELTQAPVQSWPASAMVPAALRRLDLPDCHRALAAKGLTLVSPWDSQMRVWRRDRLRGHLQSLGLEGVKVRWE